MSINATKKGSCTRSLLVFLSAAGLYQGEGGQIMTLNGVLDFTMRQVSLDFPAIHGGIIDDNDNHVVGQVYKWFIAKLLCSLLSHSSLKKISQRE